jgi:hypothetical protein
LLGIQLPCATSDNEVEEAIAAILASNVTLRCTAFSEYPANEPIELSLNSVLRREDSERVVFLLPGEHFIDGQLYAGGGFTFLGARLAEPSRGSLYRELRAFIRNDSGSYYSKATFQISFKNSAGHAITEKLVEVESFAPIQVKEIHESFIVSDRQFDATMEARFLWGEGRRSDGSSFAFPKFAIVDDD